MDFLYTTPPIMVTWQAPRADKVSRIVLKVVQEDFGNTCKKLYWLHSPFFSRIFLRLGGWYPPQKLLTVKDIGRDNFSFVTFTECRLRCYVLRERYFLLIPYYPEYKSCACSTKSLKLETILIVIALKAISTFFDGFWNRINVCYLKKADYRKSLLKC